MKNHHTDHINNKIEEFAIEFTTIDYFPPFVTDLEEATKAYNELVETDDTETLDKITNFINNNGGINKKDATYRSILFHAVEQNYENLVEHIFNNYKDLDCESQDPLGRSVFSLALHKQNPKILKLIADKVDINIMTNPDLHFRALHESIMLKHIISARILLEQDGINVNLTTHGGNDTPLHTLIKARSMHETDFKTLFSLIINRRIDISLHEPNKMHGLLIKNNRYQVFMELMNDIISQKKLDPEYIQELNSWLHNIQKLNYNKADQNKIQNKNPANHSVRDSINLNNNHDGKIPGF